MDTIDTPLEGSGYSTSHSLVMRLKSRDEAAWQRLVDLYGTLIYHWSRKCGLSPEDSADIVQETFQRVSSSIETFRREQPNATFRGWLWTITRNLIRDHARRNQGAVLATGGTDMGLALANLPNETSPPDEAAQNGPVAELVHRALSSVKSDFNEQTWNAFQLTIFQNMNATEAARRLHMTPAAVRQAKVRILRRLREELGDL